VPLHGLMESVSAGLIARGGWTERGLGSGSDNGLKTEPWRSTRTSI